MATHSFIHSFFVYWGHAFCVGWCNDFDCVFNTQLNNCFGKIWVILRRTYGLVVVLKGTFYSSGPKGSFWMSMQKVYCYGCLGSDDCWVARLAVEEALAAGWLVERPCVDAGHLV